MDDAFSTLLPEYVSKIFNVSNKAATIRLEKLTEIVNSKWSRCEIVNSKWGR